MPKILIADTIARQGIDILRQCADVVIDDKITGDALLLAIPDYDALVVRSRTQVSAPVLEAGTRLQVIARAGVGLDNIDVEAAARLGIPVVYSLTGPMISVVEHTVGLMIALARFIPQADASLRKGAWEKNKFLGSELNGKTLGIVGLGRIGSLVGVRAKAFGMRVVSYDPYIKGERAESYGTILLDTLDALLALSDFVSVHTPLTPETRGMFGASAMAKMKPGARLISCARGGVVDEAALLQALEAGRLGGAALDVFEKEPPGDNPLLKHPRVVVTPHLGAMTEEAQTRAAIDVAEQVVKIISKT